MLHPVHAPRGRKSGKIELADREPAAQRRLVRKRRQRARKGNGSAGKLPLQIDPGGMLAVHLNNPFHAGGEVPGKRGIARNSNRPFKIRTDKLARRNVPFEPARSTTVMRSALFSVS